jgi:hypothetical protein
MKKFIAALAALMMMFSLTSCGNQQLFDATYTFNYAIIALPNGQVVEGKVKSWRDCDGEQLQIVIDGVTYLTHSENVVMMANKK